MSTNRVQYSLPIYNATRCNGDSLADGRQRKEGIFGTRTSYPPRVAQNTAGADIGAALNCVDALMMIKKKTPRALNCMFTTAHALTCSSITGRHVA